MKKRLFATLLAMGMLAALAGCSNGASSSTSIPASESEAAPVETKESPSSVAPLAGDESEDTVGPGDSLPIQVEKAIVYDHFFSSAGVEETQESMMTAQVVITGGDPTIYKEWRELMNCCSILEDGAEIGAYIQGGDVSIGEEESFGMRFWVPVSANVEALEFVMDGEPAGFPEIYYTVDGFTREDSNEAELAEESTAPSEAAA
ncbi:hypothetical protein LJC49_09125 [Ruminococcaceae bacterium OttesenSCG-928-I18]|nr:hypothetical protein [Ruminococcaceae bacterium OttesenSCG-928-I18]